MAVQKYDVRQPESSGGGFEIRYWSPRNFPVLDASGRLSCIIHQVEDVSAFVELQASEQQLELVTSELREDTERMRAEVLRRSGELQDTNDRLRRAAIVKDEFLSRMSHELRSPLQALVGFTQVLHQRDLPDQDRSIAEQILRRGRLLLELVDDVLDVTAAADGHLDLAIGPIDANRTVAEAVELMEATAAEGRVTVAVEPSPDLCVVADGQKLRQILVSLLSNAIKYNHPGGEASISVGPSDPDLVTITVSDTGRGIPPDQIHRIFEPFDRLGAERTDIEGYGIGLTLAKRLAEAMGGTLRVHSRVGEGSRFTLSLPSGTYRCRPDRAAYSPPDLVTCSEDGPPASTA